MDMKNANLLPYLAFAGCLAIAPLFTACGGQATTQDVTNPSIIESTNLVGLWQKEGEVTIDDGEGNEVTVIQPTNLYKCILPDGNFFLFRAYSNANQQNISQIELYGTYSGVSDSTYTEVITTHCTMPSLSGVSSELRYNMPNNNLLNVYYILQTEDGSSVSNEWTPEVWHRVSSAL
jgi:hypothetical protein